MNTLDRIKRAKVAIMRHKHFCLFAGVMAFGKLTITTEIPAACTDGMNTMYNPDFIETLDDAELRLVILHETTHICYRHLHVWKDLWKEDGKLTNIAADNFVNLALIDADAGEGFLKMPKEGIQPDAQYRHKSVGQIFGMLKANPPPKGKGKGKGKGDSGEGHDTHDWEGASAQTEAEGVKQGEDIQKALRQGEALRRKLAGRGTGGKDGMFGDLLAPKVDWRRQLRDFITETYAGRDESTWAKPNRRFLSDDVYMPSMMGTTLSELVIGFDTSGSCFYGDEMTRFVSEIAMIIEDIKPGKCHVVYWDSSVTGMQTFEDGQFAVQTLKPTGGGGTDGSVLFDYLREHKINPQAIVNFSDGEVGNWGKSDWPTLWALTTDAQAPHGTTIHL